MKLARELLFTSTGIAITIAHAMFLTGGFVLGVAAWTKIIHPIWIMTH